MKTRLLVVNLTSFLNAIEGRYPRCDFNSLNINQLMAQFRLKQLVWVPTRGEPTLDLHCNYFQHASIVQQGTHTNFPTIWSVWPFHGSTGAQIQIHVQHQQSSFFYSKDTHPSCKCELSRYLGSLDWSALVFAPNCQSKLQLFCDLVKISLDTIIPLTFARPSNYTWTMLLGCLLSARLLSSCSKRRSCQSIWLHSRIIYPAGSHFNGVHLGASMDGTR